MSASDDRKALAEKLYVARSVLEDMSDRDNRVSSRPIGSDLYRLIRFPWKVKNADELLSLIRQDSALSSAFDQMRMDMAAFQLPQLAAAATDEDSVIRKLDRIQLQVQRSTSQQKFVWVSVVLEPGAIIPTALWVEDYFIELPEPYESRIQLRLSSDDPRVDALMNPESEIQLIGAS